MEKKRRHHYVWRHYLDAWAPTGKVWCRRRGGAIFPAATKNVALQTDFYRLREMSARDLEFALSFIDAMQSPLVRKLAAGWVSMFTDIHSLKKMVEASGQVPPAVEEAFDIALNNTEEDLHAAVEGDAIAHLASLREGRTDVLDSDESFPGFAFYLAVQHLRTRALHQTTVATVQPPGVDMDAAWGLIRIVLATGLSYNLSARRSQMRAELLAAPPDVEFLAGDQPLFNLHGVGPPTTSPPEDLALFYPISPDRALLLDFSPDSPGTGTRSLTSNEVTDFNQMLATEAHEQVFATSREILAAELPDF